VKSVNFYKNSNDDDEFGPAWIIIRLIKVRKNELQKLMNHH
jgi:hypothetical protein